MDPKGIVEMLILFLEQKGVGVVTPPFLDDSKVFSWLYDDYYYYQISSDMNSLLNSCVCFFSLYIRRKKTGSISILEHGKVTL